MRNLFRTLIFLFQRHVELATRLPAPYSNIYSSIANVPTMTMAIWDTPEFAMTQMGIAPSMMSLPSEVLCIVAKFVSTSSHAKFSICAGGRLIRDDRFYNLKS